jgi:hypothetical protein
MDNTVAGWALAGKQINNNVSGWGLRTQIEQNNIIDHLITLNRSEGYAGCFPGACKRHVLPPCEIREATPGGWP